LFFFLNKTNAPVYLENSIRAFDNPRISLSISKMIKQKKAEAKLEEAQPISFKTPIQEIQNKEIIVDESLTDKAEDDKIQEQIPVIENATFKGVRNPPVYPRRALMLNQEGIVILKALIDISGIIKDIQIIKSSGYVVLDQSAIDAVRKWKFEPSHINGKPSISWVKVPVEFMIK